MPITQVDFEGTKQPELLKQTVKIINGSSPVLDFLPFMPVNNNLYSYNYEGTLPGTSYRGFNEEYPETVGVINNAIERLEMFGGDSDVDEKMMEANGGISYRTDRDDLKAKAQGLFLTNEFFVGDSENNTVKRIDGLRTRLTGDQVLDAGTANGGDELTLDMLDELIVSVDGERPDALFMNPKLWLKINKLIRGSAQATEKVSGSFGRLYPTYADIPIATIGSWKALDPTKTDGTVITYDPLGFNEPDLDDGSQSVTASIYAVKFGKRQYVSGLQCGPFSVEDCGKVSGKNFYRTKLDWMAGLAVFNGRAAARLRGIANA